MSEQVRKKETNILINTIFLRKLGVPFRKPVSPCVACSLPMAGLGCFHILSSCLSFESPRQCFTFFSISRSLWAQIFCQCQAHDFIGWTIDNWSGLMNHGSSCLRLMVRFECGIDPISLWILVVKKSTVQAGSGSMKVWDVFMLYGFRPLVYLRTLLICNCYITLLYDHFNLFTNFMYPHNNGLFQQAQAV